MSPKTSLRSYLPSFFVFFVGLLLSYGTYSFIAGIQLDQKKIEFETLISNFIIKIQDEIEHESSLLNHFSTALALAPEMVENKSLDALSQNLVNNNSTLNGLAIAHYDSLKHTYNFRYQYPHNTPVDFKKYLPNSAFESLIKKPALKGRHYVSVDPQQLENHGITVFKKIILDDQKSTSNGDVDVMIVHLSPDKAFRKTLERLLPSWLDLQIFISKGRQHQTLYHYSGNGLGKAVVNPLSVNTPNAVFIPGSVKLYGQPLSILFMPNSSNFFNASQLALYILIPGGLLSLGLAAYINTLGRRNAVINEQVKVRTNELAKANKSLSQSLRAHEIDLEKLKASENEVRSLVNSVDGVLWESDFLTQKATYISEQVQRILGYSPEGVLAKTSGLAEFVHPDDKDLFMDVFSSLKINEHPQREFRIYNAAQEIIYIRDILTPVEENNKITKVRGVMLDITKYKKMDEEKTKMEAQLRQAQKLEAVGQLAAGIAHEINTPAQFVSSNINFLGEAFTDLKTLQQYHTELLEHLDNETERQQLIEKIQSHTKSIDLPYLLEDIPDAIEQSADGVSRISSIVIAMKEFSHPGSDSMESVDLNHAIDNTITVTQNKWSYVATIEKDFDNALARVECLPGEFNQMLLNIIVNAAQAIEENVKEDDPDSLGTITIKTFKEENNACISIADTGCGIPKDKIGKVFDPFFTTKEVGKGTGQGLSIAYSVIVDKHHGTIDVGSEPGKGTTFVLKVPFKQEVKNDSIEEPQKAPA